MLGFSGLRVNLKRWVSSRGSSCGQAITAADVEAWKRSVQMLITISQSDSAMNIYHSGAVGILNQ